MMGKKRIAAKDRLIVALDVPDGRTALKKVKQLYPAVRNFKVGLELFCAEGPSIVKKIRRTGAGVFLDLKFFDIPNTMAGAVATAAQAGPFLLNVHALAGPTAMRRCAGAVKKHKGVDLIAVTLLTSFDAQELKRANIKTPVKKTVTDLCGKALEAGLAGVVASPLEVTTLRQRYGDGFLIVTPGVRPAWAAKDDQKRIATPYRAIRDGADYIVVGRPVLGADNPPEAAEKIIAEIKEAMRDGR